MAARTRRIVHDENTRAKIQATQLIKRLTKHALGEIELEATQIRAIEILLKKTLPDLTAVEMVAEVTTKNAGEMTDDELLSIAATGSQRVTEAAQGKRKPSSVH